MKRTFFLSLVISTLCGFISAQTSLTEFDKVRQIRLLHDNRENVRRILADYKADVSDYDDKSDSDNFSTKNAEIEVFYSVGGCSENELWNADKLTVTKIEISLENPIKIKKLKFDFSNFTKEIEDEETPDDYVYHNENSGIVFVINEDEVREITIFPSKGSSSLLCENDDTKEFFANEKRFIDLVLKKEIISCPAANVTELFLDTAEIIADCDDPAKRENCFVKFKEIAVTAVANDVDNDPLTYQYTVSNGKIVGQGAKVVWDLSGVTVGTYTITAAVDDGCGFCGATETKTIVVK